MSHYHVPYNLSIQAQNGCEGSKGYLSGRNKRLDISFNCGMIVYIQGCTSVTRGSSLTEKVGGLITSNPTKFIAQDNLRNWKSFGKRVWVTK